MPIPCDSLIELAKEERAVGVMNINNSNNFQAEYDYISDYKKFLKDKIKIKNIANCQALVCCPNIRIHAVTICITNSSNKRRK